MRSFFYQSNTTAGLAILTSISYFYAGLSKKGFVHFTKKKKEFLFFIKDKFL
jgi:F0F1-type ATP synthase membrane subunit a